MEDKVKNKNDENWMNEYQYFIKEKNLQVPPRTQDLVLNKITKLLNPNAFSVFLKILGIHLTIGFLSLSICHQFGINPFNTKRSLADYMMHVGGYNFCMLGCGILFLGLSLFAAGYLLTVEEIKALKRTEFLQTLVLGLISLGLFVAVGTHIALSLAVLWLLGGLVGGFVATETVWRLKRSKLI